MACPMLSRLFSFLSVYLSLRFVVLHFGSFPTPAFLRLSPSFIHSFVHSLPSFFLISSFLPSSLHLLILDTRTGSLAPTTPFIASSSIPARLGFHRRRCQGRCGRIVLEHGGGSSNTSRSLALASCRRPTVTSTAAFRAGSQQLTLVGDGQCRKARAALFGT